MSLFVFRNSIEKKENLKQDVKILDFLEPSNLILFTEPKILSNEINIELLTQVIQQQLSYNKYQEKVNIYENKRNEILFSILCRKCTLPEEFMIKFEKFMDFFLISKYQRVSVFFIKKYIEKLNMMNVFQYQILNTEDICEIWKQLNFDKKCKTPIFKYNKVELDFIKIHGKDHVSLILEYQKLDIDYISEIWFNLDKNKISICCKFQKLSLEFIENHSDVNWYSVSINNRIEMNMSFIKKYKQQLDIKSLCSTQYLTENFIREVIFETPEKIDFYGLSWAKLDMSLNFIREFKGNLDFQAIATQYFLDTKFIYEFVNAPKQKEENNYLDIKTLLEFQEFDSLTDFLNIYVMSNLEENNYTDINDQLLAATRYQKLPESFIEKNLKYLNWDYISLYQNLSLSFVEKYKENLNWYNLSQVCLKYNSTFLFEYKDYIYFDQVNSLKAMKYIEFKKEHNFQESLLYKIYLESQFTE